MANETVKLGVSPDGVAFEEKLLAASSIKATDGTTVQAHMVNTSIHVPLSDIEAKNAATLSAAKTYTDTETAKRQSKITASGILRGDGSGGVSGGTLAASDIPTITLSKISDAGTAAGKNTGTASGNVPVLDTSGRLPAAVIPTVAITDTFVVASQAAMLALSTAEPGDVAVRTDVNKSFILKTAPYSTLANWQELLTPTSPVQSVAGRTGAVTLTSDDVGLGNVRNVDPVARGGDTMTNKLTLSAPTASVASLNMPHGTAPTAPVDGDMWSTTATLFARINGATRTMYHNGNATTAALTTATQAEAEGGTSTTVRAWTPQRVRQAIEGYKDIVSVNSESEIATSGVRPGGIVLIRL